MKHSWITRSAFVTDCADTVLLGYLGLDRLPTVGASFLTWLSRSKINSLAGLTTLLERSTVEADFVRVASLHIRREGDDRSLACLERMTSLGYLSLVNSNVTDQTLHRLSTIARLLYLHLAGNALISDRGIARIAQIQSLKEMVLRQSQLSDAGCRHLTALRNRASLSIDVSGLTDAGVGSLNKLISLKYLNLENAECISAKIIQELQTSVADR